jgi:hypothetical protein
MTPDALLKKMRDQRRRWVELTPATDGGRAARKLCYLLPTDLEVAQRFMQAGGRLVVTVEAANPTVVDWQGFVESDLIGAEGGSDPVPFAPALWVELSANHTEWGALLMQSLLDELVARFDARAEAEKNSLPG